MKRLALFVTMTVLGISNCLTDDKEKNKDVPPGLLDPSSTCGINTDVLEECIKKRAQGEGTNVCNDLKLYAGSIDKLLEISNQMAKTKPVDPQYELLKATREKLLETVKKYKKEFEELGLDGTKLSHIVPLKRGVGGGKLQCK